MDLIYVEFYYIEFHLSRVVCKTLINQNKIRKQLKDYCARIYKEKKSNKIKDFKEKYIL